MGRMSDFYSPAKPRLQYAYTDGKGPIREIDHFAKVWWAQPAHRLLQSESDDGGDQKTGGHHVAGEKKKRKGKKKKKMTTPATTPDENASNEAGDEGASKVDNHPEPTDSV